MAVTAPTSAGWRWSALRHAKLVSFVKAHIALSATLLAHHSIGMVRIGYRLVLSTPRAGGILLHVNLGSYLQVDRGGSKRGMSARKSPISRKPTPSSSVFLVCNECRRGGAKFGLPRPAVAGPRFRASSGSSPRRCSARSRIFGKGMTSFHWSPGASGCSPISFRQTRAWERSGPTSTPR